MAGIVGHEQHSTEVVERRQPAGTLLPMIVSFADPLEIVELSDGAGAGRHSSFIAGSCPGGPPPSSSGCSDPFRSI